MGYVFDNERPIYIQLVKMIRIDIVSGKYKKGDKLPSIRELALNLKVNPNTLQRALQELEEEKLIYTERTNGKFVTDDEKLIDNAKEKFAKEIVDNYLSNMNNIGIDYKNSLKYLQELGGKDGTNKL